LASPFPDFVGTENRWKKEQVASSIKLIGNCVNSDFLQGGIHNWRSFLRDALYCRNENAGLFHRVL